LRQGEREAFISSLREKRERRGEKGRERERGFYFITGREGGERESTHVLISEIPVKCKRNKI